MRNNNPGNLRTMGAFTYSGQVGEDSAGHAIFGDMSNGIRAMAMQVMKDIKVDGENTLVKLIHSWAPSSDGNDEAAYVYHLVSRTGIQPNQVLDLSADGLRSLMQAMVEVEVGQQYASMIPAGDYSLGISLLPTNYLPTGNLGAGTGLNSTTGILVAIAAGVVIWKLS